MEYDLAIIGGGITGAGIARDAALRGLKVILCEKEDFGAGASSKSSKLIHGGLRYLEQFDFALVKESLEERSILLKNDPIHVKWLPFLFPVYRKHRRPYWMVRLGLNLYDLFGHHDAPPFTTLDAPSILEIFPTLNPEGLKGGCQYYDAQMDDSRIVIANLQAAKELGAELHNYTPAAPLFDQEGRVIGIRYGEGRTALAKQVIDATGAWSNSLQREISLKPAKGVHLVLPKVHAETALTLEAPQDQRIIFLLPWNGTTLLGTTESSYSGSLDDVRVEPEDSAYLMEAYHHYFPQASAEIYGSFAGVRPLVKDTHSALFKVSRKPALHRSINGLLTVVGGKYTIYRKMAEDAVNAITNIPCKTRSIPLSETGEALHPLAEKLGLSRATAEHLLHRYGARALTLLKKIEKDPSKQEKICPVHPYLKAELEYAIEEEFVKKPEDWLFRRTKIGYHHQPECTCMQTIQQQLKTMVSHDSSFVSDADRSTSKF